MLLSVFTITAFSETQIKPENIESIRIKGNGPVVITGFIDINPTDDIILPDTSTIDSQPFESIERSAFKQKEFTGITTPSSLKTIKTWAFDRCNNLTTANIVSGELQDSTFSECPNLKTVTFGENVTKFTCNTFSKCNENLDLILTAKTPAIIEGDATKLSCKNIYVPDESYDTYINAEGFNKLKNIYKTSAYTENGPKASFSILYIIGGAVLLIAIIIIVVIIIIKKKKKK